MDISQLKLHKNVGGASIKGFFFDGMDGKKDVSPSLYHFLLIF